jgi:DNA mismatch repair protein MutS2
VLSLGRRAGVVEDVRRDGRYHVRVGSVAVWCREEDLAAPPPAKKCRSRQPAAPVDPLSSPVTAARRVDLHGLTVDDAMRRVLAAIDTAIRDGAERLEIVHGKGTGRLKAALHRELPRLGVVKAFRIDDINPGVTWVFF